MGTLSFSNEAEWHAIRELHIGGSDIASLFYEWLMPDGKVRVTHLFEPIPSEATPLGCLSSYKTGYRLFMEKAGKVKPDDFLENERIDAGKFLEPALAAWAGKKWDWPIQKSMVYHTHPIITGWGASLDYHDRDGLPVEFKNVDYLIFRDDWVCADEDDNDGDRDKVIVMPPMHILLQVQHQMGAANQKEGWVVACAGGNALYRGRIPIHEPTQLRIADAIAKFWHGVHKEIDPVEYADFDTVKRVNAIGRKGTDAKITDASIFARHARRYLRWKAHMARVEMTVDTLKARLCTQIGDANRFRAGGFKGSWAIVSIPAKQVPAKWQEERNYRGAFVIKPDEAK